MTEIGKRIRIDRIIDRNTKKTVIIPMDHGITLGPVPGLYDVSAMVELVAEGGANAVLEHKGMVKAGYRGKGKDIGLIVHLSASSVLGPDPNEKVAVTDVMEALKLGADAVSVHINVGSATEPSQLKFLGETAKVCDEWGMPLLAMMYPRGDKIADEYDVKVVAHAARIGAELGADIVKTNYTGSEETFREVVKGCPVPVVIAGGPKTSTDEEFCDMVFHALRAGGAGVSAGRNVFQHRDPVAMVRTLTDIVHCGLGWEEAMARHIGLGSSRSKVPSV